MAVACLQNPADGVSPSAADCHYCRVGQREPMIFHALTIPRDVTGRLVAQPGGVVGSPRAF